MTTGVTHLKHTLLCVSLKESDHIFSPYISPSSPGQPRTHVHQHARLASLAGLRWLGWAGWAALAGWLARVCLARFRVGRAAGVGETSGGERRPIGSPLFASLDSRLAGLLGPAGWAAWRAACLGRLDCLGRLAGLLSRLGRLTGCAG